MVRILSLFVNPALVLSRAVTSSLVFHIIVHFVVLLFACCLLCVTRLTRDDCDDEDIFYKCRVHCVVLLGDCKSCTAEIEGFTTFGLSSAS